jgi:hypothetical protein
MLMQRRSFLVGLGSLFVAPAVVKASSLMPLRGVKMTRWIDIPSWCPPGFIPYDNSKLTKQQFPELHDWFKRCRRGAAHLADEFDLGGGSVTEWYGGYEILKLKDPRAFADGLSVSVPLISIAKLKRANGSEAMPGMTVLHTVSPQVITASNEEASLPAYQQEWRKQWKFDSEGVNKTLKEVSDYLAAE